MTHLRAAKVAVSPRRSPSWRWRSRRDAELLVLGWGSTYGAITAGPRVRALGKKVANAHLVHLNPFPSNLGDALRRYPRIVVPEMNLASSAASSGRVPGRRPDHQQGAGPTFQCRQIESAILDLLRSSNGATQHERHHIP